MRSFGDVDWQEIAERLAAVMRGHPGFLHREDAERDALTAYDEAMQRQESLIAQDRT